MGFGGSGTARVLDVRRQDLIVPADVASVAQGGIRQETLDADLFDEYPQVWAVLVNTSFDYMGLGVGVREPGGEEVVTAETIYTADRQASILVEPLGGDLRLRAINVGSTGAQEIGWEIFGLHGYGRTNLLIPRPGSANPSVGAGADQILFSFNPTHFGVPAERLVGVATLDQTYDLFVRWQHANFSIRTLWTWDEYVVTGAAADDVTAFDLPYKGNGPATVMIANTSASAGSAQATARTIPAS